MITAKTREWNSMYTHYPLEAIPWHSENVPRVLVETAARLRTGKVLDVGCGAGTNAIYLAKQGFRVKAIDLAPHAIKLAKQRASDEGVDIDFRVGDALELNENEAYDFIVDRGCFHHMSHSEKPRFIKNIYRALKDGGTYLLLAFSERNGWEQSLTKEEIWAYFSGFFALGEIREELHREPSGRPVYLYTVAMAKIE
jgi:2-polyprenyl-3-methyl-5-hydroxy-6-metoxy-1,4-benzoquinol methylase